MGVKRGRIVADTTPAVREAHIRRARLDSGDQVYLPLHVFQRLIDHHSPAEIFYFVERGLLGRTAWAGTFDELRNAVSAGVVSLRELGTVASDLTRAPREWIPVDAGYDHVKGGAKLPYYRAVFEKHGRDEQARALTEDAWVDTGRRDGCCMQARDDADHGSVWCTLDAGHPGPHEAECADCWLVRMLVERAAESSKG